MPGDTCPKSQAELSARIVRAQRQTGPTHMHTHTHGSAGSPRSRGSGEASRRREPWSRELQEGGGCSRVELRHSLPGRPKPRPDPAHTPFSRARAPRAPLPRACARVRRPGALRGRPRRPRESGHPSGPGLTLSSLAHEGGPRASSVPAQAAARLLSPPPHYPGARTAHARGGGWWGCSRRVG